MNPETSPTEKGKNPLRNLNTFSSLKNRAYRYYFIGMIGQMASMSIQIMTNSLLIYRLTGSTVLLGTLALVNGSAILVTSLFGGVIADRLQKKYILLIGLGSQVVISLVAAFSLTTGYMSAERAGSWWILVAVSLFQGCVRGFMMPAQRAIIPELVYKEQVTNAVALNTMGQNVLRLLAPAATGIIIDTFDFPAVFFMMAGLYLMGVVFVSFIPPTGRAATQTGGTLTDIREGLQYVRYDYIIMFTLFWSFCGMGAQTVYMRLMPVFADSIFNVGATGMGLWLSISGAGAIVSSLTIASLPPKRRGLTHVSCSILHALATIYFSFYHSWSISLVLMFFIGIGQTGGAMMSQSILQSYSANEYRGRVMSINVLQMGLASMGTFPIGLLAASVGAPWAVGGIEMFIVFLGIMTLVFNQRYRRLA